MKQKQNLIKPTANFLVVGFNPSSVATLAKIISAVRKNLRILADKFIGVSNEITLY